MTLEIELERNGFARVEGVLARADLERLRDAVERTLAGPFARGRSGGAFAVRNLLEVEPGLAAEARSPPLIDLARRLLGPGARPVKGTLFDKTPAANWLVPWHQDLTIAVEARIDVPGFGPWTSKAGVAHVLPPTRVLEGMLALRIHLDDCGPDDGPLRVLPGTHRSGRLSPGQVEERRLAVEEISCTARAGDVLVLRPLILHASAQASRPMRRRVVHLEYAACDLPGGLRWREATRPPPRHLAAGTSLTQTASPRGGSTGAGYTPSTTRTQSSNPSAWLAG